MLSITLSDDFARAGVPVVLGLIHCRVTVAPDHPDLTRALEEEVARGQQQLAAIPPIQQPLVAAARRAYKALGKDPSRYRLASEALLRRIHQGKGLYRINTVVDVNNLVSLHSGLAVGSYRVAALAPPVEFRRGRSGESYAGIGRGPLNLANLPLLADRQGPFGSPTSDSERSRITSDTDRILMVLIDFRREGELQQFLDYAVDCLERYCGAMEVERGIVRSGAD
ncbi:MAG: phenylalanine--tRNA ligase beta subunit-related protein [Candidatus Competibacteraceae bacterium]|nr:phenylalanine--tRNA ligase beta subunit-related protein [Candidatus Competibacteraceae bacterium]